MRAHRLAIAAMSAALLAPAAVVAQGMAPAARPDTAIRVGDFMTPEEASAIGVSKMTAQQRAAFDAWLDRYTAVVLRVARQQNESAMHDMHQMHGAPGMAGHEMHGTGMASMQGGRPTYPRNGARIAEMLRGGGWVRLEDGSLWEIYAPDRVATDNWKAGSYVVVRQRNIAVNSGNAQYDMLLVNGDAGTSATARFRGLGTPDELTDTESQ